MTSQHIVGSIGLDEIFMVRDSALIHRFRKQYNGFIAIDLENYAVSRKDIPMFLAYNELAQYRKLLILLPTGFMRPLYSTYTRQQDDDDDCDDNDVYSHYVRLYRIIDAQSHSLSESIAPSGL